MSGAAPGGGAQLDKVRELFGVQLFPDIKQKATYLQWAGVHLFKFMFWLSAGALAAMFLYLILKSPSLPTMTASSTPSDSIYLRVVLAERAQVFSNFKEIATTILITFCLPTITAILGYIFGQKAEAPESTR